MLYTYRSAIFIPQVLRHTLSKVPRMEALFEHVMIQDCWVLGWRHVSDTVAIDIEASLWPGHPEYSTPMPDEWTCYKPAELLFTGVVSVSGLRDQSTVRANEDPDEMLDYGAIETLERARNGYKIEGEFGKVTIVASGVCLRVRGT